MLIELSNPELKSDLAIKVQEVNAIMEPFATVCYIAGNFMLLPKRKMNLDRYRMFRDRFDLTISECFQGGRLAHYFENDDQLREWIRKENLTLLFNGEIEKDNIKWFTKNEDRHKLITALGVEEIVEYLESATLFVKTRLKSC